VLMVMEKGRCSFFSTDLEISAIAYIDLPTDFDKKMVVHGRKLLEILREMDPGDIEIEMDQNQLVIRQGRTEFVLSLQDPEDFPEVKEVKGKEEFIIEAPKLLDTIDRVAFAVSADEARYVLTGMFLEGKGKRLHAVGTDGFRMALHVQEIENLNDFKGVIVPKRSLTEAQKIFDGEGSVTISIDEKHIQFKTERFVLISRLIEGNFPDYEHVLPNNKSIATVAKDPLLRGLKKVSAILGRSEPVRVSLSKDRAEIEAESDVGRAKEILEINYDGEEVAMNFNVRFLLDVTQHIRGESLSIGVPSGYGAVLIEPKEESDYKNIVMPIRV
jgi:DNA polymerase III subunit beta